MTKEGLLDAYTTNPTWLRRSLGVMGVFGFATVGVLMHNERAYDRHSSVTNESNSMADAAMTDLQDGSTADIIPGFLVSDGDVRIRTGPAVINTNNSALLGGNEIAQVPMVMTRPVSVENHLQLNEDDPTQWAGGVTDSGLPVFMALDEETAPEMTYYTLPGTSHAELCPEDVTGTQPIEVIADAELFDGNGLGIDAGGTYKNIAGVITGELAVSEFVSSLERQGYEPTPLCS